MLKKIFKRKSKEGTKQKPENREREDSYHNILNVEPDTIKYSPLVPDKPIPEQPQKDPVTGRIIVKKDALVNLPVQNLPCSKRKERLNLEENWYGYSDLFSDKVAKQNFINPEEQFLDADTFIPCHRDTKRTMVSRYFFSQRGQIGAPSCDDIVDCMVSLPKEEQTHILKYVASILIPQCRKNRNILDVFRLLRSKHRIIRSLCVNELLDFLLCLSPMKTTTEEAEQLLEQGLPLTFSVISETRRNAPLFQTLIQMGITLNCFLYLKTVDEIDRWKTTFEKVHTEIKARYKRVFDRNDPDVQVFVETTTNLFCLDRLDIDQSCLIGEDLNEFLPEFISGQDFICIEGFVKLLHTCNLILYSSSKFESGIKALINLVMFMNGCQNEGIVRCFQNLFASFALKILNMDKSDVKTKTLKESEAALMSILLGEDLRENTSKVSNCLLYHPSERIRQKYISMVRTENQTSCVALEEQIKRILNKCVFRFESLGSLTEPFYSRKPCQFCEINALITCIYDCEEDADTELYNNTSIVKRYSRKKNLEKELEILKSIESKDIQPNITRLLAVHQYLPKFYIKERLPGDNFQKRLLGIRENDGMMPINQLLNTIIQAIDAFIYVHGCGILVRDITTASFGCTKAEDGLFIKLKNFEMAVESNQFGNGGIVGGMTDMDFDGVPTRWAAPESLLEGHYSIYTDVWSINILVDEILNYAAWPYSEITGSDVDSLVTNIIFTHLKPQGFNRPRRIQGLILEGLASEPEQRLKLEALKDRLVDILLSLSNSTMENDYETYATVSGGKSKILYDVPPLTEQQIQANSVFERGIPNCMRKYRSQCEDPYSVFAQEIADCKLRLEEHKGLSVGDFSSTGHYEIETEGTISTVKVQENVSDEFLQYTYQRLNEIDTTAMSIDPWPPRKIVNFDGTKQLQYRFPRSTSLLDISLHKDQGLRITPYIELLYELAVYVEAFHTEGWILRCLRARNVWIRNINKPTKILVVANFGRYRVIASTAHDTHFEQLKINEEVDKDDIQWCPIESLKAGIYSKESDVYAFGMVTWEVMRAYGQQGVVYHSDEERQRDCIPFSYQESKNVLQHLIEGYIPEKPLKCPDWLYNDVTRPCLFHQRIDRPSMTRIAQILSVRLNKTPPPSISSIFKREDDEIVQGEVYNLDEEEGYTIVIDNFDEENDNSVNKPGKINEEGDERGQHPNTDSNGKDKHHDKQTTPTEFPKSNEPVVTFLSPENLTKIPNTVLEMPVANFVNTYEAPAETENDAVAINLKYSQNMPKESPPPPPPNQVHSPSHKINQENNFLEEGLISDWSWTNAHSSYDKESDTYLKNQHTSILTRPTSVKVDKDNKGVVFVEFSIRNQSRTQLDTDDAIPSTETDDGHEFSHAQCTIQNPQVRKRHRTRMTDRPPELPPRQPNTK